MSVPALAAALTLIDGPEPRTLDAELLKRAARDDYHEWLSGAKTAGGCVRPIRLSGTIRNVDAGTGEILSALDTQDTPDKVIYLPCGDRRASVCPPCAATYRSDTYQLIRAGLTGGKGMPESIASHPCVFATFTGPSFGRGAVPVSRGPDRGEGGRTVRLNGREADPLDPGLPGMPGPELGAWSPQPPEGDMEAGQ